MRATCYNSTTNSVTQQHLRREDQYNVFTAEMIVLTSTTETLRENNDHTECHIFIDNQVVTKTIDNSRKQFEQIIIKQFLDYIDDISNKWSKLKIKIIWISRHEDIDGNEHVDAEVKQTTMNSTSNHSFKHKSLKSMLIRIIKNDIKCQW